jgi:hypothetical protein
MNATKLRHVAEYLLLISCLTAGFLSCDRMRDGSIKLEANPPLSAGMGWALVKEAYVRLKESPSEASKDLDHLRKGLVIRLEGRELGPPDQAASTAKATVWYQIESEGVEGWVRDGELDIYASKAQAEKAATAYN